MNMSKLSVPEAADRLGVSPARVRQRIDDGSLVAEKIGGRWLVDLEASQPMPSHRGRPVSPSSVWWSLASAEIAQAALATSAVSAVTADLHKALFPAFNSDALRRAVGSAANLPALQAATDPAIESLLLRQSLLARMRLAELVFADLPDAADASRGDETLRTASNRDSDDERSDQFDLVGPGFVAEVKKLSRSSRNRAVHRFTDAVQDRDHDGLLAWLSNRASRASYVAAASDLAAMRQDRRLVASGVSHPDSDVFDPGIVEAYVRVDDIDGVVSDHWLEKPVVDERPNVVLHVAPVRPQRISAMLIAADLAEHGAPREVGRAHELLDEAIEALLSVSTDTAESTAGDQALA